MAFLVQGLSQLPDQALLSSKASLLAFPSALPSASYPEEHDSGILIMLPKNLSIYWVFASSVAVWFLFVHAPEFLIRRKVHQDFPLATHMTGAYTIYLACIFNTLFTPSTLHGKARPWHIWIGRIGMISGLVSFGFGLYCAWWPYRKILPPLGFSIGITVGGIAQILTQWSGYRAIRQFSSLKAKVKDMEQANKKGEQLDKLKDQTEAALRTHIYSMVSLFVLACGIPAGMRIADMLPESMGVARVIGVIVVFKMIAKAMGDTYGHVANPSKNV